MMAGMGMPPWEDEDEDDDDDDDEAGDDGRGPGIWRGRRGCVGDGNAMVGWRYLSAMKRSVVVRVKGSMTMEEKGNEDDTGSQSRKTPRRIVCLHGEAS